MADETANSIRLEEYKTLRAELDDLIKAMRNAEVYTIAGMTAVYVWLATNRAALPAGSLPWWLPLPVVVIGFLKNRAFLGSIRRIGKQMLVIERSVVVGDVRPLTWYHHLADPENRSHNLFDIHDYVLWPLLLVGSLAVPFLAGHYLR